MSTDGATGLHDDQQKKKSKRGAHLKKFHWKKGQSGNPSGRAKGSMNLSTIYRRMLKEKCPYDAKGRTWAEAIAEAQLTGARSGSAPHAKEIGDRAEGKPNQRIEQVQVDPDVQEIDLSNLSEEELLSFDRLITKASGSQFASSDTNGESQIHSPSENGKASRFKQQRDTNGTG